MLWVSQFARAGPVKRSADHNQLGQRHHLAVCAWVSEPLVPKMDGARCRELVATL